VTRPVKVGLVVLLAAVAVVVLFTVVFPWVDTLLADPVLGLGPPG
jgi:hypothetical protein